MKRKQWAIWAAKKICQCYGVEPPSIVFVKEYVGRPKHLRNAIAVYRQSTKEVMVHRSTLKDSLRCFKLSILHEVWHHLQCSYAWPQVYRDQGEVIRDNPRVSKKIAKAAKKYYPIELFAFELGAEMVARWLLRSKKHAMN